MATTTLTRFGSNEPIVIVLSKIYTINRIDFPDGTGGYTSIILDNKLEIQVLEPVAHIQRLLDDL